MVGQCDEARITGSCGKGRAQQSENDTLVERPEMSEPRAVIQHQNGHDLAIGQPRPWPTLPGRLRACRSSRVSQHGQNAWQKSSNWQKSSTSRSNMDASHV